MTDAAVEVLILGLLEWLAMRERVYEEVMDAWHTSYPRLPVREEANGRGLVARERRGEQEVIRVTAEGHFLLERSGRIRRLV